VSRRGSNFGANIPSGGSVFSANQHKIEAKLANATMRVGNRDVQLTAGMGVSVEVQTAERSVASFVFDTVLRASKEALR
jgi:hypothetical protein